MKTVKGMSNIELARYIRDNIPGYVFDPDANTLCYKRKIRLPVHRDGAREEMERIITDFHSGDFFKNYLTAELGLTTDRAEELEEALFALHSALCKLDTGGLRAVEAIGVELLLSTMAQSGQLRDVAREMRDSRSKSPF